MSAKDSDLKRVTIVIDKELDYRFRRLASQKFRFESKWFSKAIKEAINLWIENNSDENFEDDG